MLISRACYTLSERTETKPQMCLFLFALSAFIAEILRGLRFGLTIATIKGWAAEIISTTIAISTIIRFDGPVSS